jgi:transcriptional regulator with XRE-family HTH domain
MIFPNWKLSERVMISGINTRIKKLRKRKGMTLQALSELTSLSKGYLSKIESSDTAPRLPTLHKIAVALDVEMDYFFEWESGRKKEQQNIDLVSGHAGYRKEMIKTSADYSYWPLVHSFRGKYMAPYFLTIGRGQTQQFTHDSEELLFVISGSIKLSYDGGEYTLEQGDCAYFDSRSEHQISNDAETNAEMLNVVFDYKRF